MIMPDGIDDERSLLNDERRAVLAQLEDWLETPLLVLGFVWLGLFVYELVAGEGAVLNTANTIIHVVFVIDFAIKLLLAPDKTDYLKANWLTLVALVVPALRVFRAFRALRVLRAARATRGLRLFRLVSSVNRGMRALGRTMRRRGAAYAVALTLLVTLLGAAGMVAFERDAPGSPLQTYGEAVWWTAMMMTTIGSDYFPQTAEGRVLCFLLALYAFAVFGYVTATIATFFVGRDAASPEAEVVGAEDIAGLRDEIAALRAEVRAMSFARSSVGSDPARSNMLAEGER